MVVNLQKGGAVERPFRERPIFDRSAAHDNLRSGNNCSIDESVDPLNIGNINHWAHIAGRIRGWAYLDGLEPRREALANRVQNRTVNEKPASGHAKLSGKHGEGLLDFG